MTPTPPSWLVVPRPRPEAECRALFVPHAGGGPSSYYGFARRLVDVEVRIAAPPGREHRVDEEPVRAMNGYVEPLLRALLMEPPLPLVLFGHSLGAVAAYELALRLAAAGRAPAHLFLSARGLPHDLPSAAPLHTLADATLLASLRDLYGGFPAELDEHPEFLAAALRVVRADLELLERFRPRLDPLDVPLTLVWGEADRSHSAEDMLRWREVGRRDVEQRTFPGGHFYLFEHAEEVAALVARAAARASREFRQGKPLARPE